MPLFPVIPDQLAEAEAALGIALPAVYKRMLGDERIRRVLASAQIGQLRPRDTMATFVALTHELRERQPQFPRDGVVMSFGVSPRGAFDFSRGHARFWMPDKRRAGELGDTVYSWNLQTQRKVRDCSTEEWIGSSIDCADDALLAELGLEKPNVFADEAPPVRVRPWGDVASLLELRGEAAAAALAATDAGWMDAGRFTVAGRFLTPCDLGTTPETWLPAVRVAPGDYAVALHLAPSRRGEWLIVSALRLLRIGATACARHPAIAVSIDHAALCVFDRQPFLKQVPTLDRLAVADALGDLPSTPGVVDIARDAGALLVPTGEGDGVYLVVALHADDTARAGSEAIGLEIGFAPDAQ